MGTKHEERTWTECDRCGKEIDHPNYSTDGNGALVMVTRTWTERFLRWSVISKPRGTMRPEPLISQIHLCEEDWAVFLNEFLALGKRQKPVSGEALNA